MNKAVFIDRDGVINSDEGHYYIYRTEDFKLNPGIETALKLLQDNGFLLIVITNQGGVAKGKYTRTEVEAVHQYMVSLLKKNNIEITDIWYCPHHESVEPCQCRKPSPWMIEQAMKKHNIDPNQSFIIGDSQRDVDAGNNAGLKASFLVEKNSDITPVCQHIINL
jgi:D-glycero-D-manno-heptose 1,7-bisphosphate phosphatase